MEALLKFIVALIAFVVAGQRLITATRRLGL
jgi:hypothetical protein